MSFTWRGKKKGGWGVGAGGENGGGEPLQVFPEESAVDVETSP